MPKDREAQNLIPILQMILRLFGVYFFVIGVAGIADDLSQTYLLWQHDDFSSFYFDYLVTPRLWGDLVYLFAGLYLLMGGHWLISKVFLPSSDASHLPEEEEAENGTHDA